MNFGKAHPPSPLARELRKNSTLAEILLWQRIKNKSLGVGFHRQVPLDNYIVDFYCHEIMLVIEIDGNSHDFEIVAVNDQVRQAKLERFGIIFLRLADLDVKKKMDQCLETIYFKVEKLNGL